jgi:hypothetical protein
METINGKTPIGINISTTMANEIEKRAASMYLSASEFCTAILAKWVESGEQLKLEEQ